MAKRPLNKCSTCGHTWLPRGHSRSVACPSCGSKSISVAGTTFWGCSLVVIALLVGFVTLIAILVRTSH